MASLEAMFQLGTLLLCDCAECRRVLTGATHRAQYATEARSGLLGAIPPLVAGRIKDRPYCPRCYNAEFNYEPGQPGRPLRLSGIEVRGTEDGGGD